MTQIHAYSRLVFAIVLGAGTFMVAGASDDSASPSDRSSHNDESAAVQCANLVYSQDQSSVCFAPQFLKLLNDETHIRAAPRFSRVRLDSPELYKHPFAVMSGEGSFTLTGRQRKNLAHYLKHGGFLVASAGCSSAQWAASFEREIKQVMPDASLKPLLISHPVFDSVFKVRQLQTKRAGAKPALKALELEGRVVLLFSSDGLNDTAKAGGDCCCCGGNELENARQINANLLAYALTH